MNTAQYIVKKLEELGINDFFGLPGDYNFNIINAVYDNSNTEWVGCTNELNAGYAADGYARLRGYGAIITTYGVGELSAVNAIAGSFAENVPVVHIVGIPSTKNISNFKLIHHNFQEVNYFNYINTYKNITAATAMLTENNAKSEIDRVLKVLVKEKKPVYIAVPSDVALSEIDDTYTDLNWESDKEVLTSVVEKIANKINSAIRPVILGDILIKRFDAEIEYKEFVAKSGIPVTNLLMGSNIIDMDYEKYLGGYFGKYKNPIAQEHVEESDCLISVGTIYSDLNSFGQNLPHKINEHIAIYGTYVYIENERFENVKMSDVLNGINKLLKPRDILVENPFIGYKQKSAENVELSSKYIYPRLQEFIRENDIIIAETGSVPFGMCQMKLPNSVEIMFQVLWASIGWATAAGLGAAIAKPNSRVVIITGDGAHQISAMEIGTFLNKDKKPIIVVLNNKGYAIERYLSKQCNSSFNNIPQLNYSKFVRAFEGDIWSIRTSTDDDFDKALKVTQIMNKMCYIEACTEFDDVPDFEKDYMGIKEVHTQQYTKVEKAVEEDTAESEMNEEPEIKKTEISDISSSGFKYETIVHAKITEED